MDVSENSGTPKLSILIGFSIINHPFWGNYPYFWEAPIYKYNKDHQSCRALSWVCGKAAGSGACFFELLCLHGICWRCLPPQGATCQVRTCPGRWFIRKWQLLMCSAFWTRFNGATSSKQNWKHQNRFLWQLWPSSLVVLPSQNIFWGTT